MLQDAAATDAHTQRCRGSLRTECWSGYIGRDIIGIMVILYEDVLVLNNFGEHEEKLSFRGNQCPLLSEARAFVVKHSAVVASEANNGPFRALPERNIICRCR